MSKIERILSLSYKDFLMGQSSSGHTEDGLLYGAGWAVTTIIRNGLLTPFQSPTNIDSGQTKIDSDIYSMIYRDSFVYALCVNGDIHKIAQYPSSATDITVLRSDNGFTGTDGLEFFKPNGGTEYMYYWQAGTQIGRWDISGTYPTGWTDNHFTGLQSAINRPVRKFLGSIFYGNKDRIGKIYDNAGTAANNTNVLDFDSDISVKAIIDDGTYLVIAATGNSSSKLYFWDTFSPSWNKEYTIPQQGNMALGIIDDTIFVAGASHLHSFSFTQKPRKLRAFSGPLNATSQAVVNIEQSLLFGTQSGGVPSGFGALVPASQMVFNKPFVIAGEITCFNKNDDNDILIGADDRLYRLNSSSTGATASYPLYTRFIDLQKTYDIKRIDIILGRQQTLTSSSDTVGLKLYKDGTYQTSVDFGSLTKTEIDTNQKVSFFPQASNIKTDMVALELTVSAGTISIKRIDIYGEPISQLVTSLT